MHKDVDTLREKQDNYFELNPDQIADDINRTFNVPHPQVIKILDTEFSVFPHVYPSHKFRSTYAMLDAILKHTPDKKVCEVGCGCGTLGQMALLKGASKLIQGDINPYAVKNAIVNKQVHNFTDEQLMIYESDCFDNIPKDNFDVIIFAMPYHNDNIEIKDPLMRAFYDPNFASIRKFLTQVCNYVHPKSDIFIAFSNKGDTEGLELIFEKSRFSWELYLVKNRNDAYDNRVYRLYLG